MQSKTGLEQHAEILAEARGIDTEPSWSETGRLPASPDEALEWAWAGAAAGSAEAPYLAIMPGMRGDTPIWTASGESGEYLGEWDPATHTAEEALAECEAEHRADHPESYAG